ncbi:hypothetical protein R3P38DRAFT_3189368 [Favolaschia claudopus]|uniref:Uncharacterized protein n=1 Tax=Favolaschia claudopus TaxID=2862362 RepID=A0AAW0BQY4_9AGAR
MHNRVLVLVMPEAREAKGSFGPIGLEAIEIDATKAEAKRFAKSHPAANGLPYRINSNCTVTRGNNNSQGSVYPPMWRIYGKQPVDTTRLSTLALTRLEYTYRGIVVDLGPLSLMIQYLTHTSAHPMRRDVYDSTIKIVNKQLRKYMIGMALIFKDHVLAFHSHDLIFQVGFECLPGRDPNMRTKLTSSSERNGLATEAIREASDVFLGIGVYTVIELFFLAGLSPQLTEAEVFDSASRTARLVVAYRTYLHTSEVGLPDLIRPAMKDGILAPTEAQRLGYINWLHVYAKDRCKIPVRMAKLVDDYVVKIADLDKQPERWIRHNTTTLFDVFEPSYHSYLIFGKQELIHLGPEFAMPSDPLTEYFEQQGLLNEPTFLRPNYYSPLFLPQSDFKALNLPHVHRHVHTYRHDKQIWSIVPATVNSQGMDTFDDAATLTPIVGDERKHMLFSYIVKKTNMVAIGPLEYSGTGHRRCPVLWQSLPV